MNSVIRDGWLPFSVFCQKYGVKVNGNQYRKLKVLSDKYKFNVSGGKQARWIVNERAACKLFGKEFKEE